MRLRRIGMAMLAAGGLVLAGANTVAAAPGGQSAVHAHRVCATGKDGSAGCHSWVVTDAKGKPMASTGPTGLSPSTIVGVYGFPTDLSTASKSGDGTTIAIVDAYDDPTAEADLNTFSSQFRLPACTTANGCFKKVNQNGTSKVPRADAGWALEISLDVQWAHAMAPAAKILLVEAGSASFTNLLAAEDYAAKKAKYISNSWGGSEFSGERTYDRHFQASGVSYFVSAGDNGTPAEYPSSSPNVLSVGGTRLNFDSTGQFTTETGWTDGGGGCSLYEGATGAQASFVGTGQKPGYAQVGCAGQRATPDLSLDADPASGVAVYDSTSYQGQQGWFTVGGTSASSPMIAGRSAVTKAQVTASTVYGGGIGYRDIVSGNNGKDCLAGFDLCSGRGSWLG